MNKRLHVRGRPIADGRFPLVCAPLVGPNRDELLREAALVAAKRPDVVEWRVDAFEPIASSDAVLETGRALRAALGTIPLLFTRRWVREGGRPGPLDEDRALALYEAACADGWVDLVDYELGHAPEQVARVCAAARRSGVTTVLSFHDFEGTPSPDKLEETFAAAERAGADAAKVAVTPRSPDDVLALLRATLAADRALRIPLVSVSMGPYGALTRTCGWMFGSVLTFAVGAASSAPGQLPIDDVRTAIAILQRGMGSDAD